MVIEAVPRHAAEPTHLCRLQLASSIKADPACAGKRVVELGAGGGALCAMAAATTCRHYTATDGSPAAVSLLRANLRANAAQFIRERVACCRLLWGDIAAASQVTDCGFRASTARRAERCTEGRPGIVNTPSTERLPMTRVRHRQPACVLARCGGHCAAAAGCSGQRLPCNRP